MIDQTLTPFERYRRRCVVGNIFYQPTMNTLSKPIIKVWKLIDYNEEYRLNIFMEIEEGKIKTFKWETLAYELYMDDLYDEKVDAKNRLRKHVESLLKLVDMQ